MTEKRERNIFFGFEAIPHNSGRGFAGAYRAPGLEPGLVRLADDGRVTAFSSEAAARLAAAENLISILNKPRARANKYQGRNERYIRLTGPEFSEKLQETGITMKLLVDVIGTKEQRVFQWIDGVDDKGNEELAPHYVNVLLEIFKRLPQAIDIAEEVTDAHTTERRTKAEAPFTDNQVAALKQHQNDPERHPYTCPGDKPDCADGRELEPTTAGMVCKCGDFTQTWAHAKAAGMKG